MGCVWGTHWLPHDAKQRKQFRNAVLRRRHAGGASARRTGGRGLRPEIIHGIPGAVRDVFSECWFDETRLRRGLSIYGLYRKNGTTASAAGKDKPHKDGHAGSDAFRQFAQVRARAAAFRAV